MLTGTVAASCANHAGATALARCRSCRLAFCDECCLFEINDDVWCEACGSGVEEDSRPRYLRGAIVLAIGFGAVTAVLLLKTLFVPVRIPYFLLAICLGYAGSMLWAWNVVSPVLETRPTVLRRNPGRRLPRGAQRV